MFGTLLCDPGPGRRPHRLPADAGRQPARVERQPADRARHARPAARRSASAAASVVVVDPRRSRTAEVRRRAPLHPAGHRRALPVRARPRALRRGAGRRSARSPSTSTGSTRCERAGAPTSRPRPSPTRAASRRTTIRRIARELAAADSAAVYGRIGTCTQEFGTLASWLVDVLNVLTGNLDRPGGAMFTRRPPGTSNTRGTPRSGAGREARPLAEPRPRAAARSSASCRSPCLAEEIETPGEGQIRALITFAGNPVLSHARTRAGCAARSSRSSSWSASTSTSTRRPATPT